ncbi:MAG TPA: periplasmic heavy metal sensor [Thermoanaerobaculia bacterium]|nr:periplasmic heavy metal sensor [Thermoanaerobaculia bacterium]
MRRWWLAIALLLSVGLNLGILAAIAARRAQPGPRDREPRPGPEMANPAADPLPRLPRLADRLGLEGEERRKFLDLQWDLFQQMTRLRLQMGEVHRELKRELTRGEPDRQRVDALLQESARIYGSLERKLVDNVLATRELLGPEKEKEYLRLVGRLRVPNPGGGLGFQGQGPRPQRPPLGNRPFRDRLRERRMRERFPEGPPPEP